MFTHERRTTSGDTLRSRCEGEGSLFSRQLVILRSSRGSSVFLVESKHAASNYDRGLTAGEYVIEYLDSTKKKAVILNRSRKKVTCVVIVPTYEMIHI